MRKKIRQVFITGLAVTIPIGLSLYVFFFLIGIMDNLLRIMPNRYHPDTLLGFHIPGLGAIATFLLILIVGLAAKSYMGNRIVALGDAVFHRIPVIRSVYEGTKQVVDNMFVNKSRSFKKVVLVEFPSRGSYAIGFVTGEAMSNVEERLGKPCSYVFVPTTPNPTSGYLLVIPDESLVDLDMTVEEAFTFIISCGIVNRPYNRSGRGRFITP
ncbi:MAG: DUF502 domain-containing protein [Syntrophales bacterium]|nr:DUF502 domain-containing protein [Syntrophales bacterium]